MSILLPIIKAICRHKTPKEAEAWYKKHEIPPRDQVSGTAATVSTESSTMQDDTLTTPAFVEMFNQLPAVSRLPVLSELFLDYKSALFKFAVTKDFLCFAASA